MHIKEKKRVWITSKDVAVILELSVRQARRRLASIRRKLGKERGQPVSIAEFCAYMALTLEYVYARLGL